VTIVIISVVISVLPRLWVSELFCPELAGTVPVYVGEDEVEDFVVPADRVACDALLDVLERVC